MPLLFSTKKGLVSQNRRKYKPIRATTQWKNEQSTDAVNRRQPLKSNTHERIFISVIREMPVIITKKIDTVSHFTE